MIRCATKPFEPKQFTGTAMIATRGEDNAFVTDDSSIQMASRRHDMDSLLKPKSA